MPSFISHGVIGYLLFGYKGLIVGILPDLIGYIYFILKSIEKYNTINPIKLLSLVKPDDFNNNDYIIYNLSHSLILWIILLFIFKDKIIYAAIIAIIMDIFLHSNEKWKGPLPFYPLNNYQYNGIEWSSYNGQIIIYSIILLLLSETIRNKIKNNLFTPSNNFFS